MRSIIFIALIVTLSVASSKEHQPQRRDNTSTRRYKDTKNKRGIGDYPSSLAYGGPSFQSFQSPSVSIPFSSGLPSFGSYGSYGSGNGFGLSHGPFNLASQPSSGFSNLGVHSLASSNLGSYASNYNLPPSALSLSLLASQSSGNSQYSSPNIGLYSVQEKTGPVTFTSSPSSSGPVHQQYTPVYATATQLGSNGYSVPVILGASPTSNLQITSFPTSSLSGLSSHGLSAFNSLTPSSSSSSGDSSAHAVSGGYVIATTAPQQSISPSSYSVSTSAQSPSGYAIAIPAAYGAASNSAFRSSSSPSNYQSPVTFSSYSASPSTSSAGGYLKYSPTSSDTSTYFASNQLRSYGTGLKSSSIPSSSNSYGGSLSSTSVQSNAGSSINYISSPNYPPTSLSANHVASAPTYSSNNLGSNFASASTFSSSKSAPSFSASSSQLNGNTVGSYTSVPSYLTRNSENSPFGSSSSLVTSYGTPAISYPSTSYGTPSNSPTISSSNYNSQNSEQTNSSPTFNSQSASSYSAPHDYVSSNPSSSYNADSQNKNSEGNFGSSAVSFSGPSSNYESSSSISNDENYNSSGSSSTPNVSNSIETYSSSDPFSSFESPKDSSGSFSNGSPRYFRYPLSRTSLSSADESPGSTRYDTIAYSVGSGKY